MNSKYQTIEKPEVPAYFFLVSDGKILFGDLIPVLGISEQTDYLAILSSTECFFSPFGSSFITGFSTAASAIGGTMFS
ncbi:hypothetical protein T03_5381 [Trichinella britovi]|uniref:Uncharacterized protein n=1 Tax=Trichinella britovi TaxID=45882 RepID=A0A0V1C6N5_TRIBR|nr:hypothetical protein T03_5381 [Trichinella britovi]